MFLKNPYISILKLKSSIVDLSVVAVTCAVLGTWDYRAAIGIIAGIMIHGACDIINDIYDVEIDKICKPKGAIASGQISEKNAWRYMILLISAALIISFNLSFILFTCLLAGIIVGGIMYSHTSFRLKDKPGMAMANMGLCFALESIGIWSIYSHVGRESMMVAAYIFILVFSLTFMKDFKDVAGDINSLPLLLGIRRAAKACSVLAILPLIPLLYLLIKYDYSFLTAIIYLILIAGCIRILMGNPVVEGHRLKNWMILALTVPNFSMLFASII
ncbi:Digeranylgeranylglyceryl phosphate synthase [uncultured archaeon]|nr:Digeranylgeranylglyceryl phosphate synthase [uncultured archaeon]